jgi:hypothetical protein
MRLELNELRQYLESAEAAEREMIFAIKEDLLTKLKSKFDKLDIQLRALKSHMRKHTFIGQVYEFRKKPDPKMDRIRRLAIAVAENPEDAQSIIERKINDALLVEAMDELESYLANTGGVGLEDYRTYFTYDLLMGSGDDMDFDDSIDFDESLMRRSNMASLRGKTTTGSGGEGQAPFYVAIAVSMAMAYYPGAVPGREQSGMGVVLFDEAFSKPDIPTTQALIKFYKDLGLQLILAAPEDKRPTFTEVMDTIVSVNKDEIAKAVYISSEFPKEHLRREMAKINPDHIGVEGFRQIAKMREAGQARADELADAAQ